MKLITKWEHGTLLSDLAAQYGKAKSAISTILNNKEAIKAANVAKGVKILISKIANRERSGKNVIIWINEK
jgi:hypothetical protein